MRPFFKICALLKKDQNKHVHKDTVCNVLYSKVILFLFSRITYTPQNRQALLVFLCLLRNVETKPHYRRSEELAPWQYFLWTPTTDYTSLQQKQVKINDGEKEQTKWRFHSRRVWSIHMLAKPRTRGHPISDWLMTALLQATSERAFSIIDISCFGYMYPSQWIRIKYRHSYRLWCHIKWSCMNEKWQIAQVHVKNTNTHPRWSLPMSSFYGDCLSCQWPILIIMLVNYMTIAWQQVTLK